MQLYIGNKNYSSWSLRSWLAMRESGIDFDERRLRLDSTPGSDFKTALAAVAPAGKVPVLVDDGFAVWDTLAIAEYLAEKFPALRLWPADARMRARARSLCAEMHSGFAALRSHCPMNIEARFPALGERLVAQQPALAGDLARIAQMWRDALDASGGPFLFGAFCNADAYFAPVCSRIETYALPVAAPVRGYADRVLGLASMRRWIDEARAEHDFLVEDEPYRSQA